jgi:hypothetical protein
VQTLLVFVNLKIVIVFQERRLEIPWSVTMSILRDITTGMAYLHTDIPGDPGKPALLHENLHLNNVLLTSEFTAKVGFFSKTLAIFAPVVFPFHYTTCIVLSEPFLAGSGWGVGRSMHHARHRHQNKKNISHSFFKP